MADDTPDFTACTGADSTCGLVFRHKTVAGPCEKCKMLGLLDETSNEYTDKAVSCFVLLSDH